jgi:hypothetical protein
MVALFGGTGLWELRSELRSPPVAAAPTPIVAVSTHAGIPASPSELDRTGASATAPAHLRASPPVRVIVPSIGVSAPVIRLGLTPDHTLQVPTDFSDAGWWSGGAYPGQPGPAVIVGHVDSVSGPAVFYRLRELRSGDHVIVRLRDGGRVTFVVQRLREVSKAHFPTREVYGATRSPTIRLITCGGAFDAQTGHYVDNVVVFGRMAQGT